MKWQNTCVGSVSVAEQLKEEMDEAGIKTGDIFSVGENRYMVPWKPIGRDEYQKAIEIIEKYFDLL